MPITTGWYRKNQNIIMVQLFENWTLEELRKGNLNLLKSVTNTVMRFDLIINFTETSYTLPVGMLYEWESIITARDQKYPNWGLSVIVANSPVHQAYFDAGFESLAVIRKHCRLVKTLDEAVQVIIGDRQSTDINASAG